MGIENPKQQELHSGFNEEQLRSIDSYAGGIAQTVRFRESNESMFARNISGLFQALEREVPRDGDEPLNRDAVLAELKKRVTERLLKVIEDTFDNASHHT